MPYLTIDENGFPDLCGKVAVVSGGSSGIGLATVNILLSRRAKVYNIDLISPPADELKKNECVHFLRCDVTSWNAVRSAIQEVPYIDMCFANAGIAGPDDKGFVEDQLDDKGQLVQPNFDSINVNIIGTLNLIKMCRYKMRKRQQGGSIVMTASSAAYSPEKSIPIYSATKGFMLNVLRSYRHSWIREGISLNAVAPCPTLTNALPLDFISAFEGTEVPVSDPHDIGLALVYSATATEERPVEQAMEGETLHVTSNGKWNGRMIWVCGKKYTEVEETFAQARPKWLGEENDGVLRKQQQLTKPWWV